MLITFMQHSFQTTEKSNTNSRGPKEHKKSHVKESKSDPSLYNKTLIEKTFKK